MPKPRPPHAVMLDLSIGHWISRLTYVAAKLKLADLVKDRPRTVEGLDTETSVQAPALYRVLRALASVGIFEETKDRRFKLTPLAATLQTGGAGSLQAWTLMINEKYTWDSWEELLHGVKTHEIPFVKAHGVLPFEYLERHPEDLAVFGESMTSLSGTENPAIASAYSFSKIGTLVDVGGGHGSLLATILRANPKLHGVLVDNVIPPGNDPSWGKLLDIQMLIIGGRERTKKEFAAIFAEAGLKMKRVVPTRSAVSIVEGVRG